MPYSTSNDVSITAYDVPHCLKIGEEQKLQKPKGGWPYSWVIPHSAVR